MDLIVALHHRVLASAVELDVLSDEGDRLPRLGYWPRHAHVLALETNPDADEGETLMAAVAGLGAR
jgi:hypothetical protein